MNINYLINYIFFPRKSVIKPDEKDHIVNVQIRAFSGGERESTQMDMTGSGEAAKLGKVSSREAIDPYIRKFILSRRMATDLPGVGRFSEGDIKKYVDEFLIIKDIKIGGSNIYFGKNDCVPRQTLVKLIPPCPTFLPHIKNFTRKREKRKQNTSRKQKDCELGKHQKRWSAMVFHSFAKLCNHITE